ncbi:MAG: hypothetical protein Q8M08_01125 [Bacteroidales bacterium]|nr:hypothetical protein [Bacteroidales bacterium]
MKKMTEAWLYAAQDDLSAANQLSSTDLMPAPLEERLDLMRSLMWDYNIAPEQCLEVLEGKREKAGHYTEATLFRKLLESFSWFTILKIIPPERILQLLTDKTIQSLRFKSLTTRYEFIRSRLQESLSASG